MALKENDFLKKINDFFVRNWWLNGISNVIIIILFTFIVLNMNAFKNEVIERINKANMHIIYGTVDGRVALLDRKTVNTDNEVFQNYIADLAKKMEASQDILTGGFDPEIASKITSPVALLKVNENFALLYKEFFIDKHITLSFLRYYFNLLKSNDLAVKSSIIKTTYTYKSLGKGKFSMRIVFKTNKDFINKVTNKNDTIIADDIIYLEGFIDPTKYSTTMNPYGVKFTKVRLRLFTYNDYIQKIR